MVLANANDPQGVVMLCDSDDSCTRQRDDNTKYYCNLTSGKCTQYPTKNGLPLVAIAAIIGTLVSLVYIYYKWWFFLFSIKAMSEDGGDQNMTGEQRAVRESRLRKNRSMAVVLGLALFIVIGASIFGMIYYGRSSQATTDCSKQPMQKCDPILDTQVCNPSTNNTWTCTRKLNPCPDGAVYNDRCKQCVTACADGDVIDAKCSACVAQFSDDHCNFVGPDGKFVGNKPIGNSQFTSEIPQLSNDDKSACVDYNDTRKDQRKARLDAVCVGANFDFYCGGKCQKTTNMDCSEESATLPFRVSHDNPEWLTSCPAITKKRTGDVDGSGVVCASGQCSDPGYRDFVSACLLDPNGCPPGTILNKDGVCASKDGGVTTFTPLANLRGCRPESDTGFYEVTVDQAGVLCKKHDAVNYSVDLKQTSPAQISGDKNSLSQLGVTISIDGVSDANALRSFKYWYYLLDIDSDTSPVMPKTVEIENASGEPTTVTLRFRFIDGEHGVVLTPTSPSDTSPTRIAFDNLTYQIQADYESAFSIPQMPAGQPAGPVKAFRIFVFVTDKDDELKYVSRPLLGSTMATCVDPATLLVAIQMGHDDTLTDSLALRPNRLLAETVVKVSKEQQFDIWKNATTNNSGANTNGRSCVDCTICPPDKSGDQCRIDCHKDCFNFNIIANPSDMLAYAIVPCGSAVQCYFAGKYMLVILAWEIPTGAVAEKDVRFYVMREQLTYTDLTYGRRLIIGETLKDANNVSNASVNDGSTDPTRRNTVTVKDPRSDRANQNTRVFYTVDVAEVEAVVTYSVGAWDISRGGSEWNDAKVRSPLVSIRVEVPGYTPQQCMSIRDPVHSDAPFYSLSAPVDMDKNLRPPRYCEPAAYQDGSKEFYCLLKGYYGLKDGDLPPVDGKAVDAIVKDISLSNGSKPLMMYSDATRCSVVKKTDYLTDITENGRPLLSDDEYLTRMRFDASGGIGSQSQCIKGMPLMLKLQCGAVSQASTDSTMQNVQLPRPYPLPPDGVLEDKKVYEVDPAVVWGNGHLQWVSDISERVDSAVDFSAKYLRGTGYEPVSLNPTFKDVKSSVYACPDPNAGPDWKAVDDKTKKRVMSLLTDGTSVPRGDGWTDVGEMEDPDRYVRHVDWLPASDTDNKDISRACCNTSSFPKATWRNIGNGQGASCACNPESTDQKFSDQFRCSAASKKYRCAITNLYQRTPRPFVASGDKEETGISARKDDFSWEHLLMGAPFPQYACVEDDVNGPFTADDCMKGVCAVDTGLSPVKGMLGRQLDADHNHTYIALLDDVPYWPPDKPVNDITKCLKGYEMKDSKCVPVPVCPGCDDDHSVVWKHCKGQCEDHNRCNYAAGIAQVSSGSESVCVLWANPDDRNGEMRLKYGPPFTNAYFGAQDGNKTQCYTCWGDGSLEGKDMVFDPSKEANFPFRLAVGNECDGRFKPLMNCTYLPRSDLPPDGQVTLGVCAGGKDSVYEKGIDPEFSKDHKRVWKVEKNESGRRCRRKIDPDESVLPTDPTVAKLYCENIPECDAK